MKYEIISVTSSQVTLRAHSQLMPLIRKAIHNIQYKQPDQLLFKRRVIPFFLNQFYLYSIDIGLQEAIQYLQTVKNSKRSKQKKFELGDIEKLFRNKDQNSNEYIVQKQWITFLEQKAISCIEKNGKITSHKTKQMYQRYLEEIQQETIKSNPYKYFLSKTKLVDETQETEQYDSQLFF
ncbi:hypothetical protein pb186bvf_019793 [Paramecium bursaria]